ncbi:MAG: dTDP-4-dehydrorhamnose reductase [Saprospiraceae bacterium]
MQTPTLLITGANGQVGQELLQLAPQFPQFNLIGVGSTQLDITDKKAVDAFFATQTIHYCINCAAYTAVDKAENDTQQATAVNVEGVRHLAMACQQYGAPLIHLSTDYVYHHSSPYPITEDAPTLPQSVYAQTKLDGENVGLTLHHPTMVIRTSWVYSSFGHNFVKTMLRLGQERAELKVVFDQIGTPTYAKHLAEAILQIIDQVQQQKITPQTLHGIFHYSNEGVCSWYDFATIIFQMAKINCQVFPIESKDYPTPAKRPPFSVLNKGKIKATFGLSIPHWTIGLNSCLAALDR